MSWFDGIGNAVKKIGDFTGVTGLVHDIANAGHNSDPWYVDGMNILKDIGTVGTTPVRAAVKGFLAAGQESYKIGGYARQAIETGILDTPLMYNKFKNADESYDEYRQRVAANKDKISLGQAALSVFSPGKNTGDNNALYKDDWTANNLRFMSKGFDIFNPDDRAKAFNNEFSGHFITGATDLTASTVIDPLTVTGFVGKGAVLVSKGAMLDQVSGKATRLVFGKFLATPESLGKELATGLEQLKVAQTEPNVVLGQGAKDIQFLADTDAKGQYAYWEKKRVTNPDAMAYLFGEAKTPEQVVDTYNAVLLKDSNAISKLLEAGDAEREQVFNQLSDLPKEHREALEGNLDGDQIVHPQYVDSMSQYLAKQLANPENQAYREAMNKVLTGTEVKYGIGKGPRAGAAVAAAEKDTARTFTSPEYYTLQPTSMHPLVKVYDFFTKDRPSGTFLVNDANSYKDFNIWLREANDLTKGAFGEKSAAYADEYLNAQSTGERFNVINRAEKDAMATLFPDYSQEQLDKIYAIFDSRRQSVITRMKNQGFVSYFNGDQVEHAQIPLLQREGANTVVTADLRRLKNGIDAHAAVLPNILSGVSVGDIAMRGDRALKALDTVNDIFKTSVLLRLGYTTRNLAEAGLSIAAKGMALPAVAAAGGKDAVGRFFKNRATGFQRLSDSVNVMLGRKENVSQLQATIADVTDQLRSVSQSKKNISKALYNQIQEIERSIASRGLNPLAPGVEGPTTKEADALKRLHEAFADAQAQNLYHGSADADFKFDSSRPIALTGSQAVAKNYSTMDTPVGIENYLKDGMPASIRGVTGKGIESARPTPIAGDVTKRMTSTEFNALKIYVENMNGGVAPDLQSKLRRLGKFWVKDFTLNSDEAHHYTQLKDAVRRSVIDQPMTLHRSTRSSDFMSAKVGDVVTDKGFISTSKDGSVADTINSRDGNNVQLIIHAPKGTPGLDINNVYKGFNKENAYQHESEVLLAPGLKFKVLSIKDNFSSPIRNAKLIEVEIVPSAKPVARGADEIMSAGEAMKQDMAKAHDVGHTVLFRQGDNQTFHKVNSAYIQSLNPSKLERAVFRVKQDVGSVHNVTLYGKPLNITDFKTLPEELKDRFGNITNLRKWVEDKGWKDKNDPVFKYLRDNGYGSINVPDEARAGGVSTIALPEAVGPAGRKRQIDLHVQELRDKALANAPEDVADSVEQLAATAKERRGLITKVRKSQRSGLKDRAVSPYYTLDSANAAINNGVQEAINELAQREMALHTHLDDLGERLGASLSRAESTAVKQRLGYGTMEYEANGVKYTLPKAFEGATWFMGRTSAEDSWMNQIGSQEMAHLTGQGARSVRIVKPTDPRYFEAWSNILNMHFRDPETGIIDPVVEMILDGKTDKQIQNWMTRTDKGRYYANDTYTQVGSGYGFNALRRGDLDEHLAEKISQTRNSVKLYVPDQETANLLKQTTEDGKPLTGATVQQFLTDRFSREPEKLQPINGLLVTQSKEYKDQERLVDTFNRRVMRFLGSLPEDTFARHPLVSGIYERQLKLSIAKMSAAKGGETLTADEINRAVASSREWARQEAEKTLFTIVRRTGASSSRTMKLLFPFYAAYENTLKRWGGMIADNPSIAANVSRDISQVIGGQDVVDGNGNKVTDATKISGSDNLIVRVPQGFIDSLPGAWKDVANNAFKQIQIPLSSLDVITQGQPGNPGWGPFATLPAYMILKDKPEAEKALSPFFPAGQPQSAADIFMPSVLRRLKTAYGNDGLYVRTFNQMLRYETYNYNTGKRTDAPTMEEVADKTRKFFLLRALQSVTLPVSVSPELDFYAQQYRQFQNMYPPHQDPATKKMVYGEADAKFLQQYPDFFTATISLSKNAGGLEPSIGTVQNLKKFSNLMSVAQAQGDPELMGFLANDGDGKYTFSQAAYQWMYSHGSVPGAANAYLQNRNPAELVRDSNIKQGWTEYQTLASQIDSYKISNNIVSNTDPLMKNMNAAKKIWVEQMKTNNPDWYAAYISPDRGKYMRRAAVLEQAVNDPKWMKQNGNRPVVKNVALYLDYRKQLANVLATRKAAGGSADIGANSNADVAYVLDKVRTQLSAENVEFGDFINRYFPNDPVTV